MYYSIEKEIDDTAYRILLEVYFDSNKKVDEIYILNIQQVQVNEMNTQLKSEEIDKQVAKKLTSFSALEEYAEYIQNMEEEDKNIYPFDDTEDTDRDVYPEDL